MKLVRPGGWTEIRWWHSARQRSPGRRSTGLRAQGLRAQGLRAQGLLVPRLLVLRLVVLGLVTAGFLACLPNGPAVRQTIASNGFHDSATMAPGDQIAYRVPMESGQVLRLRAEQDGVDVILRWQFSRQHDSAVFDSQNGPQGPEWLVAEASRSGEHYLTIEAISGKGNVSIAVETLGTAKAGDIELMNALHLLMALEATPSLGPEAIEPLAALLAAEVSLPPLIVARTHYQLARALRQRGRHPDALAALQVAADQFNTLGNAWDQAPVLNDLGSLYRELAQNQLARETLEQSIRQCRAAGHLVGLARAWNNLGLLHASLGDHPKALDAYRLALDTWQSLGSDVAATDVRHNIGEQLLTLGKIDEGIAYVQEVVETLRGLDNEVDLGSSLSLLAWGFDLTGQKDLRLEALARQNEAVKIFTAHSSDYNLFIALEGRSRLLYQLGHTAMALADLETSWQLAVKTGNGPTNEARYRIQRAHIEADRGQPRKVIELLAGVIEKVDRASDRWGQIDSRYQLARAERQLGHRQSAIDALEDAIQVIEAARAKINSADFRRSYLASLQEIFEELLDLRAAAAHEAALAGSPQAQELAIEAFRASERGRSRALLDLLSPDSSLAPSSARTGSAPLHAARLRRVVQALETQRAQNHSSSKDQPDRSSGDFSGRLDDLSQARVDLQLAIEVEQQRQGISSFSARPESVEEILDNLDSDTVLLSYALGEHRSWLFVIENRQIRLLPLPPRRDIDDAARDAHSLLPGYGTLGNTYGPRDSLARLARKVLPAAAALPDDKRWLVVPMGALHLVPFGLLPRLDEPYLMANHDVMHVPSASSWLKLRRRWQTRRPASRLLAIVADPVFDPADPRFADPLPTTTSDATPAGPSLPRLPASRQEAEDIAALATQATGDTPPVYLDFDASRQLVTSGALRDYAMLHFATHGLVDARDPALAGLVLSLYDANGKQLDGLLTARELVDLRLDADLVTLSACRTALGQEVHGEGLVGLAHGFFAAGASQLIVSLWEIDDRATSELMQRFYRHLLLKSLDPAAALRLAQLEMRDHPRWSAAAHWGAFVAVGDWRNHPPG